ncbi:hypothetical protein BH11ACT8_BH11ACT8_32760 [soil metagenome]
MLLAGVLPAVIGGVAESVGAAPAAPPAVAGEEHPVDVFSALDDFRLQRGKAAVSPTGFLASRLDVAAARSDLTQAPTAADVARGGAPLQIEVPAPDGSSQVFAIVQDPVLAPGLAARHPEITTYAGTEVSDPSRSIRLDLTPLGFHASVRGPGGDGAWYVDPAYRGGRSSSHLSYYGADVPQAAPDFVERDLVDTRQILAQAPAAGRTDAGALVSRRTFRLAFLTDPSYAAYFGTDMVLAAKTTLINRVDQVYNDDLGITFELIDGTEELNLDTVEKATGANGPCGASACFTEAQLASCSSSLLTRNNFVLGQLVGADSFDLGHIGLGVNGGGIAGLGVVGGSDKSSGCTGLPKPQGDFYAIDYVAHEMGHQMGGNHTFNGTERNCSGGNRNAGTSVEPGSGSSVMAYAGICDQDDLQDHTDPYFSQRSIDEITDTVSAATSTLDEEQSVNLTGFDTNGDSFELTYPGAEPITITRGGTSYTGLAVSSAIFTLTGCRSVVYGYDSAAPVLNDDGFSAVFNTGQGCRGTDLARMAVGATTGDVSVTIGVLTNGGPTGNQGDVVAPTTNHAPTVVAPADTTIPARTPFVLTGSATDVDPGTALTYLWEQNDDGGGILGVGAGTALVDNTKADGPLFRVFGSIAQVTPEGTLMSPSPGENQATTSPTRIFPDLEQILAGNTNAETGACPDAPADATAVVPDDVLECYSEFLPTADYGSALDFRLTARDGFPTGGGTQYDDVTLDVDTATGPFQVTSRADAGTTATGGATETVTWDVNGTDAAALAPMVRISVSLDGGHSYPYVAKATTPNDGSQDIVLPRTSTTRARVLVSAVGNYFFDVNDADFTISGGSDPVGPRTRITGGLTKNGFVVGARATYTYRADQRDATFRCTIDGASTRCGSGSVTVKGLRPGNHTFTVAARSAAGVLDTTPATRHFAVVHNERVLKRATSGWKNPSSTKAYRGTYYSTQQKGQELTYRGTRMNRLAILVTAARGFGRVQVLVGTTKVGTIDLGAMRPSARLVTVGRFKKPRTGVVRIRTLDGKPVLIDGLGVFQKP